MFKEQKETIVKEVKDGMMTMSHQRDNINEEVKMIQIIKRTKLNSGVKNCNN
jgi:hypothetical protein